jgi:hypothetical protein
MLSQKSANAMRQDRSNALSNTGAACSDRFFRHKLRKSALMEAVPLSQRDNNSRSADRSPLTTEYDSHTRTTIRAAVNVVATALTTPIVLLGNLRLRNLRMRNNNNNYQSYRASNQANLYLELAMGLGVM